MKNICLLVLTLLFVLAGCSSSKTKSDKETASVEDQSSGTQTFGAGSRSTTGMNPLEDPSHPLYNLLQERVIYFEYDRSEIQEQYRNIVAAHASYLAEHPDVVVTLEGHADERGSREYNLALGERRSMAVERQMTLQGASASNIRTVSYGEERPVATGHDESSWSVNRRVEILY